METAHEGTSHRGLKDSKAGVGVQELCRKHSISDPTFNKVADEIRGPGRQRCEKTAPTARKKPAIETAGGRASAGHPDTEGDHHKTLVMPKAKRTAALLLVARSRLSQRRNW